MLFLQLETALADARASLEQAGETLHDASVQAAQRKSEYEAKADTVRRLEGAIGALHGGITPLAGTPPLVNSPRKAKPKPEGPQCAGCGEFGTLTKDGPLIVCSACQAQSVG